MNNNKRHQLSEKELSKITGGKVSLSSVLTFFKSFVSVSKITSAEKQIVTLGKAEEKVLIDKEMSFLARVGF